MNSFIIRRADIKDLSAIEILERQLDYGGNRCVANYNDLRESTYG